MYQFQFLTGLDVNSPSWDLFIYLFFIIGVFVYGFTLGRSRILMLLISTYIALAVLHAFTLTQAGVAGQSSVTVGASPFFIIQITAFIGALLLVFFALANTGLRRAAGIEDKHGKVWQIIAFSIAASGLMVASVLSFIPPDRSAGLLEGTRSIFSTPTALLIWTVLPIVLMFFVKDEEED